MQNFAEQCIDLARSILGHNLDAIQEDGSIQPVHGESPRPEEPGHAALAIGEFFRATQETKLDHYDLVDLAARCITAQAFTQEDNENGLAYSALGLLSFGPAKDRNLVWERLMDPTRDTLDKRLLARTDYDNHLQAFNIAKSVARFSIGLSKKDETSKLIDKFLERIDQTSSTKFFDDSTSGIRGTFDNQGVMSFVLIRQALQLHANASLRERKLPSLRTYAEKYLKLLPDLVRNDGLAIAYGQNIGAYGQMHPISMILQSFRDGWIPENQRTTYLDILRKLFFYFYSTFLDLEHGYVVIRDHERDTSPAYTTRMANFDTARYLCQWARLSKYISSISSPTSPSPKKTSGKFISFDKSSKKEQGLFIYESATTGLLIQLPLISASASSSTDSLAFPHCPNIFDWPVNKYLPILLPELKFGDDLVIPSFYGKNCVTGLGLKKSFFFKYEQPELITNTEKFLNGLGNCKVTWTFTETKISSEFTFTFNKQTQLDGLRYVLALSAPHSAYRANNSIYLGEDHLRVSVVKDDFQASWADPEVVSDDPSYKTYWGKIHYLITLHKDRPMILRPNQQYRLVIEFEPDIQSS